jgi:hypothetical protein
MLAANTMYGCPDKNKEEYFELNQTMHCIRDAGNFIVTYASSDTPGYCGPMIFVIWPDTSVTHYRKAGIDLPSFKIAKGEYYQTDMDGMPWPVG